MAAKRENLDEPIKPDGDRPPGEAEMMDRPSRVDDEEVDRAAELGAQAGDIIQNYNRRTDDLVDSGYVRSPHQYYRVAGEQIGFRMIKPKDEDGPAIFDHHGGIRKSKDEKFPKIIKEVDLEVLGKGAVKQLPRFLRLGVLVPVIPYTIPGTGEMRWIDVPTADHRPFTANQ